MQNSTLAFSNPPSPQILDLVELTPIRNAQIGMPGISGLSVEQRK